MPFISVLPPILVFKATPNPPPAIIEPVFVLVESSTFTTNNLLTLVFEVTFNVFNI